MITHIKPSAKNFRQLNDNKTVGLITRSELGDEVQVTHHHSIRGSVFKKNLDYYSLMGGGLRVYAVKLDPNLLFKQRSTKKKTPIMKFFLECVSIGDILLLRPTESLNEDFIPYFAILTPVMMNE